MLRKAVLVTLGAVLAVALAVASLAEVTHYGTMMVDNCEEWVSLRDGPGTGCKRLAKVPLFALVTDAQWSPICDKYIYCCYDGQFGYILSQYLVPWADPEPEDPLPVRVDWAEATDRALVVDADGEYVTIMADAPVSDVALLALALTDCDEDGNAAFDETVVRAQDALHPDAPLVVRIAFPGDTPSYGLRFTDAYGEVRRFAIGISGMDGTLVLEEY